MKYSFLLLFAVGSVAALSAQQTLFPDSVGKAKKEVNVLFGKQEYGRFVGNMNSVTGDELTTYPSVMVNEALAGRLPGVFIRQIGGTPGIDDFDVSIRGSMGEYIVLVNGVERELTQYDIEQIEEISVLKDPVSKALYGGRMSNGIIMVTTKRGKNNGREFRINVQQGLKKPTRLPKFLDSYDFAVKYNEALINDGAEPLYSAEDLDAYKSGAMPYKYPNVDFYGEFLNETMNVTRVNAEYYGGDKKTKYYVHGAYQNEGGLEKYGDKKTKNNTFNLQGNLDTQFSDFILLHANFAGYIGNRTYPGSGFSFSTLSSRYPNAYPVFVNDGDSVGGTSSWLDNPYAVQAQSGYTRESQIRVQGDMSLTFKLDKVLKGLSIKPVYSFDIYHMQKLAKIHRPAIYSIASFDSEGAPLSFNELQSGQLATSQSYAGEDYLDRWAFMTTVSYNRRFNRHAINADLLYYLSKLSSAGELYDYKRQNLGLRVNYTFDEKYTFEGVLNYVGSQSYAPENRFKFFPAAGIGWLISEESFLKDASIVDFLKLNATWGIMGDGNITPNLWRRSWGSGGRYYFNNSVYGTTSQLTQVENLELDWPKQREIDINIEANLCKSVYAKLSYFDYQQSGLLSKKVNSVPAIIGGALFLPYDNFEKNRMNGWEAELAFAKQFNGFSFRLGGHVTYSQTKKIIVDELIDPNFTEVGTPVDAIWGYRYAGYYTQEEIDQIHAGVSDLPILADMNPLALKAGNIKYKDLNGDNVIDKYDMEVIGNSNPQLMYGFDIDLGYKGFNLYVMFLGYGKYKRLLNSDYYQIYSTKKYSNVLLDGLPNGNPHPMLTTGEGTNDFQTSDYWIVNGGYLKLQNLAFSYSLPKKIVEKMYMKELKFTFYGTDLFTCSKIKDLDPESDVAGLTQFPLFSTYALGVSVTF